MLSIVILAHNEHEMTRECLAAVYAHTRDYEVILVDNGSEPPIAGATIRNTQNLGFPAAVNQAIRASHGDVICLLNNDCIVTPGWAERLVPMLERFAIVGPMTSFAAGVQLTGVPVYYDADGLAEVARAWTAGRAGRELSVNWVTGFCFLFKRSLFGELGDFDESLWPCSGEEIDFCLRARAKGYAIGIAQDIYVHHEGSVTLRAVDPAVDALITRNNKHLADRWKRDIWGNQLLSLTECPGLRLNLGCGKFKLKGFTNIDQLARVEPDVNADVMVLPYDPGTVDEIYAGHLLEHFPFSDGMKALHYWYALLRPGGRLSVSVPDYDFIAKHYVADPTAEKLQEMNDVYIYSEHQESHHHYMYSGPLLVKVLTDAGFVELERMPIDHPYFPMAVDWQVGYTARKR